MPVDLISQLLVRLEDTSFSKHLEGQQFIVGVSIDHDHQQVAIGAGIEEIALAAQLVALIDRNNHIVILGKHFTILAHLPGDHHAVGILVLVDRRERIVGLGGQTGTPQYEECQQAE